MFNSTNSTIWIRHDSEASARAHGDPTDQMRDRVHAMEHNLETLRTRLTQVADLRDAQGIREDHRAIVARLIEVEECASVHTLRELMSKNPRLESMLSGETGGVVGEDRQDFRRNVAPCTAVPAQEHAPSETLPALLEKGIPWQTHLAP